MRAVAVGFGLGATAGVGTALAKDLHQGSGAQVTELGELLENW